MSTAKETYLKALGFVQAQQITHPQTAVQVTKENHIEVCEQINGAELHTPVRPTHYGIEWYTHNNFIRINFCDWIFVAKNGAIHSWIRKEKFDEWYRIVEE